MEADVLRDITFPVKKRTAASKQQRSEPSPISRNTDSGIRDLLGLALIFGGGLLLTENMKLKRENEELRKMIAGEVTTGEKYGRPGSSPATEKHEETSSQSSGGKQQSDP